MSKNYSNEHPKYKKKDSDNNLSKSKNKKLLAYKSNGSVGDSFMKFYNNFRSLGALPESAFNAAQREIDNQEKIKYLQKAFTLNNPPKLSKVYSKSEQGKKKKKKSD